VSRARALLVGLGQIGCGYDADLPFLIDQPRSSARTLSHARALACHPGFALEAGVDPSPEARARFTRLYGVPAFADLASWRAACTEPPPDLVVIAVDAQLQPALVQTLLQLAPPRLLLLEKPVACDLPQARALQAACGRQPQLPVAVNYIRRWLPAVQAWRRRLQAGELGRLLLGRITYGKGLLSNGSHFVNLAEAWLGPLTPGRLIDPGSPCFGFDREASLELLAADHGQALLQVQSIGAAGLRAGELDLWFERGRLCWPDHGQAIAFWPRREPAPGDRYAPLAADPELIPTGLEHYQLEVVEALHRHLRDPGASPLQCDLSDGLRTLETLAPACADDR
jgi:predicted dehydrogenase